ncbi:hypothetical protein Nepgr_009216 [Nepenthes gracilis]|uniref:Uncharacterized protein n=1 Tax=Nepenthes gracilis TaxID=150966 RepID=A0AAD3SAI9_NEPGR|nr:hypothetical protein Nepgr_009216 [Nepenthes gracilis]
MELPKIPNSICIAKKQSQTLVRTLLDLTRTAGVWPGAELSHPLRQSGAAGGSASMPLAAASTAMKTAHCESPYLSFRIE